LRGYGYDLRFESALCDYSAFKFKNLLLNLLQERWKTRLEKHLGKNTMKQKMMMVIGGYNNASSIDNN
jgi:hypothetical protein